MTATDASEVGRPERRWVLAGVVVVASVLAVQIVAGAVRSVFSDEPSYLEQVQICLTERSTPYGPASDPVAASAGRGALATTVDGNPVTVALGSSESDAERVYQVYVAIAPAEIVGTRLERSRKVVLLWEREPTAAQREFMLLCTLDAQE